MPTESTTCPACNGLGFIPYEGGQDCERCGCTGLVTKAAEAQTMLEEPEAPRTASEKIVTASGAHLDSVVRFYGLVRGEGETDAALRDRVIAALTARHQQP